MHTKRNQGPASGGIVKRVAALIVGTLLFAAPAWAALFNPGQELLFSGHRALLHREAQPDFNYDSAELRRTGHWLFPCDERRCEYISGTLGRPREHFGSYVLGGSVGLRRQILVFRHSSWYMQIDSGLFITDAYKHHEQRLIGQAYEFRSRGTLGCSFFLSRSKDLRLLLEANYEHISNAGMSRRNLGADDLGLSIGMSWRP
jgi:hypothetical protein